MQRIDSLAQASFLDADEKAFIAKYFEDAIVYVLEYAEDLQHCVIDTAEENIVVYVHPRARVLLEDNRSAQTLRSIFLVQDEAELTVVSTANAASVLQRARLKAGANFHLHAVTLGQSTIQNDVVSELVGEHANSNIDWIFYAKDSEKYELSARTVFSAPNGGGEMIMKGVAEEKAHVNCDGMIEIGLKGGGTNTYLTQNVLMLDATAKVDAIPGLEIKTNDVKASHSATVSRVTPEDLFYFNSRGIAENEARAMFVEGFLGDLAQKIPGMDVRERVVGRIGEKYKHSSVAA